MMMTEIRHALRRLRATPIVTTCAITCLTVGVWMTLIVSAFGKGFFRPTLELPSPERLVMIDEVGLYTTVQRFNLPRYASQAVLDTLAKRRVFAAIGFYRGTSARIAGDQRSRTAAVLSAGMMEVLVVPMRLGRRFLPADDSLPSMIISSGTWRGLYGSDPDIVGRSVQLMSYEFRDNPSRLVRVLKPVRIVGVAQEGFNFPRSGGRIELYLSAAADPSRAYGDELQRTVLARLRADQSLDDVRPIVTEIALRNVAADREAIVRHWRSRSSRRSSGETLAMGPVDVRVARYYNEPVKGLLNLVVLVLGSGLAVVLVAASNAVSLLLIRGAARRQEIAVRLALGATRMQILRGLIVETGLIAVVGSLAGFMIAFWQWRQLDSGFAGRFWFGDIEWTSLPYALAAGLALTLIVGVWPGLRATSMKLEQVLRDTRRTGISASPLDSVLGRIVAASTAGTVMLLVCASLLGLSSQDWISDRGLTERKALTSMLTLDDTRSRSGRAELARQALERARRVDDVRFAVLGGMPNEVDPIDMHASVAGKPDRRLRSTMVYDVSDGWLEAMDVRMVTGRRFNAKETRDSTSSVVISRTLATQLFGAEAVIDRSFRYWADADSMIMEATVVGVAETQPGYNQLQMYRPYGQRAPVHSALVIGSKLNPASPAAINKAVRGVPGVLSSEVESQSSRQNTSFKPLRYMQVGFILFSVVGILLGAIGMYGIIAYSVVRRTHEIGVRIALGADSANVVWMILEQGLKITLVGTAFGLILAHWATRLLGGFVEDLKVNYPLTMTGVVILVMLVSVIASLIPGYRAGRLNPVDALRAE
jgi:putative ABC transport system permease protein